MASLISSSRMGRMRSAMLTTFTLTPRCRKADAYSVPMTPAPRMVMLLGSSSRSRTVSLSTARGWLKSTSGGRWGTEPVAITKCGAW